MSRLLKRLVRGQHHGLAEAIRDLQDKFLKSSGHRHNGSLDEGGYIAPSYIDVRDHGALCDNATDDATAVQAAVTAATAAGGGQIWFPRGTTTLIGTTVTLDNNVELIIPASATVKQKNGANTTIFSATSKTNCGISGLGIIDGNRTNNTSGVDCVKFDTVTAGFLSLVTIKSAYQNGIHLTGSSRCFLTNVLSYDNGINGLYLNNSNFNNVSGGFYDNNRRNLDAGGDGVRIDGSSHDNAFAPLGAFDTSSSNNFIDDADCEAAVPTLIGVSAGSGVSVAQSTDFAKTGTYSIKLTRDAGAGTDHFFRVGSESSTLMNGMTAGEHYTFSAWLYVPTAGGVTPANVYLRAYEYKSGAWSTIATSAPMSVVDTWVQLVVQIPVDATATGTLLRVYVADATIGHYIYADNLSLQSGYGWTYVVGPGRRQTFGIREVASSTCDRNMVAAAALWPNSTNTHKFITNDSIMAARYANFLSVGGLTTDISLTGGASTVGTSHLPARYDHGHDFPQIGANTLLGNNTGSTADISALTVAQVQTLLGLGALAYLASVGTSQFASTIPKVSVYNALNVTITTNTETAIDFDTERYDTGTDPMHFVNNTALGGTVAKTAGSATLTGTTTSFTTDLSVGQVISVPGGSTEKRVVTAIASNTSLTVNSNFANTASGQTATRVNSAVVCRVAGKYSIGANVRWAQYGDTVAPLRILGFKVNDTTTIAECRQDQTASNNNPEMALSRDYTLAQWDYVELRVWHNAGGNLNVEYQANYSPEMWMHYLP